MKGECDECGNTAELTPVNNTGNLCPDCNDDGEDEDDRIH